MPDMPIDAWEQDATHDYNARQQDVLNAALSLLAEQSEAFTMAAVARRASCSKETLYKWFGDREGFLVAMVRWQAAKVQMAPIDRENLNYDTLFAALEHFAFNWLKVLTGDISIALNRLAISHAGSHKTRLGTIVLTNGPYAMAARLKPLLLMARERGLLQFEHFDMAFRTFFGLVVRDVQIRVLLGDKTLVADDQTIRAEAHMATQQFFSLLSTSKRT